MDCRPTSTIERGLPPPQPSPASGRGGAPCAVLISPPPQTRSQGRPQRGQDDQTVILTSARQSACLADYTKTKHVREAPSCPLCWPSIRAPRPHAPLSLAATFRLRRSRKLNSRSTFPPPAGSSTSRRISGIRPSPPAARR